ncbi:hypothetical protein HWV62_31437 [Athelia sp. TMB]|nr:hypothetical protein HWV62_31437 [Athelia sp. TMB]
MASPSARRPLPSPPAVGNTAHIPGSYPAEMYRPNPYEALAHKSPYHDQYEPSAKPLNTYDDPPTTTLSGGTMLHQGFYDLLSMIPTPSPSRLIWGATWNRQPEVIAGPRYEDISATSRGMGQPKTFTTPSSSVSPKKRRVSKDMVSSPTGFVHLVHASDADQAEALLTRWGPDGLGKLGDPRWANPIIARIRQRNQEKAVNEVINALKPLQSNEINEGTTAPLRVMNGISTATSSALTTAAQENFSLSDGLPGRPGNSTIRWTGGLKAHPEMQENEDDPGEHEQIAQLSTPPPPRSINPSLSTMEKAVSARIYFENLYFPLFRHPPSREQRRIAMETDMMNMKFSETQKENLRARWRQNETDYLRDRRRKVDASAFIKLKTIGHGAFGVVSLVRERPTGDLYAMKQLRKTDMLRKGQEGHVRAERDILKSASLTRSAGGAEWIVRLHYSFQDRDHLYLVLEYMGGGDLLNLLIERDTFEEDFTRFYVAEVLLACLQIPIPTADFKTDLHWAHDTSYYEQQRIHLLHKYGIDLEDSNGIADGTKTKRMDKKDVESLMGGDKGSGGVFTWREKNRRKCPPRSSEVTDTPFPVTGGALG